jgi:predicted dehydrogenase
LRGLFDFDGRAYTDLAAMLDAEKPDIVDVCSPPCLHFEHTKAALTAGCDVLCEKPFVHESQRSSDALLEQARELMALSRSMGKRLGICTQYVVGAQVFVELWNELRNKEPITHFHGHLEAPARGRKPDPARVWVDLAPHLLSVAQYIAPDGFLDYDTLTTTFNDYEALASFELVRGTGERLPCDLVTRNATDPPRNVRHFKFNGFEFAVEGHKGDDGVYGARIDTPDGSYIRKDMMHLLIAGFLRGNVIADAQLAVTNLEWLLGILDRSRH